MSLIIAPLEVLLDDRLTDQERRVLLSLYSFRGKDTANVWPSVDALSERARIKDKKRVSKITSSLAEKGWVSKKKRGFNCSIQYNLKCPELVAKNTTTKVADLTPRVVAGDTTMQVAEFATVNKPLEQTKDKEKNIQKRKSQIPADFSLTEARQDRAVTYWQKNERPDLNAADVFDQFTDHHAAKGSVMLDWDRAWNTWFRNAIRFTRPANNGGNHAARNSRYEKPSLVDEVRQLNEARAKARAEVLERSGNWWVDDDGGIVVEQDVAELRPQMDQHLRKGAKQNMGSNPVWYDA